jgi:hypothetical protein
MAATRRLAPVAWTAVVGALLLLVPWAVVGFDGLREYPGLLRRLNAIMDDRGYTVQSLALELGASTTVARILFLAVAAALLAAVVLVARRGDERGAFVLAIAASLACTPVVWLHYFALLLVAVAVAQPRLGPAWFVPLAMFITPGSGDPTLFETSVTVAAAALTVALALRASHSAAPSTSVPVGSRTGAPAGAV